MPGRKQQENTRQERSGEADECTSKMMDAAHHANTVGNLLDSLIPGQGKPWFEVEDKLTALIEHARRLAV